MKLLSRVALWIIGAIAILVAIGISYQYIATKIDDYKYPAPGIMVDVGGFKLHIKCSGSGNPTIILDAGMGCSSIDWTFVQQGVEQFAHVCSYDRAGLGWSEKSPNPRTSIYIVEELHTLLHNIHAQPPYILVGHSFGGNNIRLYANTYPDEVFGVILVDSSSEKVLQLFDELNKQLPQPTPPLLERIKNYILQSRIAVYLGIKRLQYLFRDVSYPDPIKNVLIAKTLTTKFRTTDEVTPALESSEQLAQSINTLQHKPLTVITTGKFDGSEKHREIWLACQKELTQLSKQSKQLIAEKSGHMINHDQPEIIIDAIREMVEEYRHNKNIEQTL